MPQERLSLATIHETVSGGIGKAFDRQLAEAVADCHDRPALKKPRIVVLRVAITPEPIVTGDNHIRCEEVNAVLEVDSKLPKRTAVQYSMKAREDGTLTFSTSTPDGPNQLDLEDERRQRIEQAQAGILPPGMKIAANG